jgi:hypothetical protein
MENNSGRSDARTYTSSENTIVEIFQIGTSQPEEVIETPDIDTVELVDTEISDDTDCPVVIEEVIVLADLPDLHMAVTNISVNLLPRRLRFASTWKRIKRSALRLCCCVHCDGVRRHYPFPTTEDVGKDDRDEIR